MTKTAKIYLGPMAGITDRAFREICMDHGADKTITEMISAKGLYYGDKSTGGFLSRESGAKLGIQIFGSDPEIIGQVIEDQINPMDFEFLDFNMGCPAPKIFNNGDGSALMKDPDLAYEIMKTMVQASNKPVHIKFRLGVGDNSRNYLEIGRLAEKAGVARLCLHARTRNQFYSGLADRDAIKALVEEVSIPVTGNGDIDSAESALHMLDYTGCDSIMVGRGALGNPFIFEEIRAGLEGRPYEKPGLDDLYRLIKNHYAKVLAYKGPRALVEMRKHTSWYLKGLPGSSRVRDAINKASLQEDIEVILEAYMEELRETKD